MGRRCLLSLALVLGLVTSVAPAVSASVRVDDVDTAERTTYTSPQLRFRVNWALPWSLAQAPQSKARQYDVLSLVAGKIGIDYAGIFTRLDPAAFFRGAVAARRRQFPDLIVTQPYLPASPGIPGILIYTSAGVRMTDLVYLLPLKPGRSLLMIAESFPSDISASVRRQADGAVHLDILGGPGDRRDSSAGLTMAPQSLLSRLLATPFSAGELPVARRLSRGEDDDGDLGARSIRLATRVAVWLPGGSGAA